MKQFSPQDLRFMRLALQLARRGGNKVSPNPQVGCVLVKNGRIVGRGYHAVFGGPHAEARALQSAGARARGATAYVNLEPCCHTGKKTPPCVPALIASQIRRVVIGTRDPNPLVSGRGIRLLSKAGIESAVGVMEQESKAINRPFIVRMREQRPYVILKAAASLDGRIKTAGGQSQWITSPEARKAGHEIRAAAGAVLVGAGTVLADNPSLTAHGTGKNPLRIVLDSRLRIPAKAKVFNDDALTFVFTEKKEPAWAGRQRHAVSFVRAPRSANGLDLRYILRWLWRKGIGIVLVEGGSRVHTSFLEAGLVDELRLFIAPLLIGGREAPGFFEGHGFSELKKALKLSEMHCRSVGPDLLISGCLGNL